MKESKAMKEIHDIREKNYETTKEMSVEEYINHIRCGADRVKKQIEQIRKNKPKVI